MEEENLTKKDILKGLVLDEKDTLEKLKDLVNKSKDLIRIEGHSGKIVFVKSNLSLRGKIILLAVGKYFSKELGLSDLGSVSFDELRKGTGAESQALSRPIGMLLKENILAKEGNTYTIKYYQIEKCIDNILESKPISTPPTRRLKRSSAKKEQDAPKIIMKLVPDSIRRLAEKVNMDENELKHIFEFEDNDVRIILPIEGKSEGDRQLKATLLYLVAYRYCFGLNEIASKDLRRKLQDLGIRSLVNLSTQLKSYPNFIWHKLDKQGSTSGKYKITTPGEIEGIKLIAQLKNKIRGDESETTI